VNSRLWSWLHDASITSADVVDDWIDLAIECELAVGRPLPVERIHVELHGVETFRVRNVVEGTAVELAPNGGWSFDVHAEQHHDGALLVTGDVRKPPDTCDVGELTMTYRREFVRFDDSTRFTAEQFDDVLLRNWKEPW